MMDRRLTLALAGDVMLGRNVDLVLQRRGPAYPWGNVLPYLRQADLAVVNLECVVASGGTAWDRWPKAFHFRAHPGAISCLQLAGVDAVTLANNHVLDYGEDALLEMLARLDQAGIAHAGAGRTRDEAARPAILDARGVRVGLVAFTDNEPGWAATAGTPGTNWIRVALDEGSLGPVREGIAAARAAGADLAIFAMHWGPNMVRRPPPHFRAFARAVIDAGADVFFGHSAHVVQGIEVYRGRPIIYDAGDFVDDYAMDPALRNDRGLLFRLGVEGPSGIRRLELLPTLIADCQVNLAAAREWEAIADLVGALSAELGTAVRREAGRLWVDLPAASERVT